MEDYDESQYVHDGDKNDDNDDIENDKEDNDTIIKQR